MKNAPLALLVALLLPATGGCIYVHVTGDLDQALWDEGDGDDAGFYDLTGAVETCLADPSYDLALDASPWHGEAEWTVRYADEGSDGHAAFRNVREAVLRRIEREGGTLTEQHDDGPHAWSCSFRVDDEPGKASVRLVENADEGEARPHRLEVFWEESD